MKYLVVLCDGMADEPNAALNNKTPMQLAKKPNIDALAKNAEIGMCKTVANGLKPGSDVANLSVMGYDPFVCYTGRSPLEAASIGIDLKDTDVCLRCNLVTLSNEENYSDKTMLDYCAGDISTEEAAILIDYVNKNLGNEKFSFYSGVAYRHCLVVDNGTLDLGTLTPPHDITNQKITEHLSTSANAKELIDLMVKSYDLLKDHPVNKEREAKGLAPANSIWLWGEGSKPQLEEFEKKFGVKGAVISAVDLLKGIGKCAKMQTPAVEGATGYIDTNFDGKAKTAIDCFEAGSDLVYIHVEAPDECGHRGECEKKVRSIELIDEKIVGPVIEYLNSKGEYRVLVMPDHPTPLSIRTHSSNPVPYLIYDSTNAVNGNTFTEENCVAAGNFVEHGPDVMKKLLGIIE